jgi:hypothetical protein
MPFEPLPRPPYPVREKFPKIEIRGHQAVVYRFDPTNKTYVNGELWKENRVGAAILNYTKKCQCGNCDSCLVGMTFLQYQPL